MSQPQGPDDQARPVGRPDQQPPPLPQRDQPQTWPPQQGGYPQAGPQPGGFPAQAGYPPGPQGGYHPQGAPRPGGHPQQGYPQQGGYPQAGGYPQGGYPSGPGGPYNPNVRFAGGGGGMPPRKPAGKVNLLLIVGIAGALLIGIIAWALFGNRAADPTPPPPTATSSPTAPPTTAEPTTDPTQPTQPTEPAEPTQDPVEPQAPVEPEEPEEPAPDGGMLIDLGDVTVVVPAGWEIVESEPGLAVVTNSVAYITLQSFRTDPGVSADAVMSAYIEQMAATFHDPVVDGPHPRDVGPDASASVMVMQGVRTTSAGSFEAVLGSTIASRNADGVAVLSSMLVLPEDWNASVEDYNMITADLVGALLIG